MNRIRKYKNEYQVLITPYHRFDPDFSLMLGNWNDENLQTYSIKTFNNMEDAMTEAFDHPDIDWNKVVLFHKYIYVKKYKIIKNELEAYNFLGELDPHLLNPKQLKNIVFDRVMHYGKRFTTAYFLNDVIGFHIINPYTKNLNFIMNILINKPELRINRYTTKNGIIRLIGDTDIGTSYEIVLWPTLISTWAKYNLSHPEIPEEQKMKSLKEAQRVQKIIDSSIPIS